MKAVYYGVEPVFNFIKHINLPNYRIYIADRQQAQAIPIFSSLTGNLKTALEDFKEFSNNILLGNATDETTYYIKFYKNSDKVTGHQNETYYAYNKEKEENLGGVGSAGSSISEILGIMQHFAPMAKAQAENDMLKLRIEDLENAEPEPNNDLTEKIINTLGTILPQLLGGGSTGVQIAGDEVLTDNNPALLQKALTILKEHDKDIETDLYKLSQIAVNNPEQFKMLINMLRNM
jgi:hypothetical protein